MVQPISPTMTQPLAYRGGIAPKSTPGFGAQLTAMLGQVQATSSGLQALGTNAATALQGTHHHHHGPHDGPQPAAEHKPSSWQPGGVTVSAAHAGNARTI